MGKHQLKMAKASKGDIDMTMKYLNYMEYVEDNEYRGLTRENLIEDFGEDLDDGYWEEFLNSFEENDFKSDMFISNMNSAIGHRWRRVVMGCDILIDNFCDEEKTYLDFKPDLKTSVVLSDVKTICKDIFDQGYNREDFDEYWEGKEKELTKEED